VDRVLPKYREWLAKYPSLRALADAPDDEVAATWRPLGYNVRPRRLQSIARESVARFDGRLPSDADTLRSFKGIGEYTAAAVLSFAFGQRAAILDTNVARVLHRVFVGHGDTKAHATLRRLWALSRTLLPRARVYDFNQALMDFGATRCTARRPRCGGCPMARRCAWLSAQPQRSLPLLPAEPRSAALSRRERKPVPTSEHADFVRRGHDQRGRARSRP
jgi:A/G-specific adenine glycosylase